MPVVTGVRVAVDALIGAQHPRDGIMAGCFFEVVVGGDAEAVAEVFGAEDREENNADEVLSI